MWQMSEVVIINDLFVAFPNDANLVTAILSWPALFTAVASLLAGKMLQKVSTKMELIIAGVLMIFGVTAAWGDSMIWLTICSFIMAIGAGFANTAGMAILSEVFVDPNKRARQMGYYNAVMSVCGIAITYLAGILALNGWQAAFSVNWFSVPMLILTILFIPNIKPSDRPQDETASAGEGAEGGKKEGLGSRFWIFFVSAFLFFMAYCAFFSFISVFVAENNLGDTAFTGLCSSLTTAGSLVASLIFGAMFGKMRRKVSLLYLFIPAVLYIWAWTSPSQASAIIFSIAYGFVYGGFFSLSYAYTACCVPPSRNGFAMGLITFNYSVGITLGIYLFTALMGVDGGTITGTYPYAAAILAVSLIIEIIANRKDAKDHFLEEDPEAAPGAAPEEAK